MIYGLSPAAFTEAFPFHIVFDANFQILQTGRTLARLVPGLLGVKLSDYFLIQRPAIKHEFEAIRNHSQSIFLIQTKDRELRLKGQMLYLEESGTIAFLGSPWIADIAQIAPLGLELKDFAIHDPISDYLLLLQSKNSALQDTKKLAEKLSEKQKSLRTTNAELQKEIAERLRIEGELEKARDQALEASRLKSEFLATMSHEIRTPMNGIIGMSELLLETELDEEQLEYAQIVFQEAEILLGLLNDILDFSKIEAGKIILETVEFSFSDLLEQVTRLFSPKAQQKELALITYLSPSLPATLLGDSMRIRQILTNLLSNAIKFTSEGEVIVKIQRSKKWLPAADDDLIEPVVPIEISVQDTGIGMSQAVLDRLFASFVQADGSTTRRFGGTGLGLAISKSLVELMNGTISVNSEAHKGSTFTITLPLTYRIPTHPSTKHKIQAPEGVSVDKDARKKALILVVEDHKNNQRVALASLQHLGYDAHLVENGKEAVDTLQCSRDSYAAVLMDWQMPVMDGIAATRKIRELERGYTKAIPIIGMTANAMKGDREKCLAAGMNDYISKPINLHDLVDILGKWVKTDHATI